jgi:hypothetical protein
VKNWAATLAILPLLSVSLALAEDFTTINGKTYKNATISHVEADGIVLRTKNGISKIYFVELPKDIQERFHYVTATPISAQRQREPVKVETKKDGSRQTGERSWVRALPVTAPFLRLLILGALIITGAVLVIIRSRFS